MMNRSKIDWCDFTWNPVTGCLHECPYCYARKQAMRFCGDIRFNKASLQLQREGDLWILEESFKNANGKVVPLPVGFEPALHRYRLGMPKEKKLPANIFVCSMADLFGDWVPDEWIEAVFNTCKAAPWHNYLFLTKFPERYQQLEYAGRLPHDETMWYGTSITNLYDAERIKRIPAAVHRFVSVEPVHGPIDFDFIAPLEPWPPVEWIIVGAETGNRKNKVTPERSWITGITGWAHRNGVPILQKDSAEMRAILGKEPIKKFPRALTTPSWETRPVHKVFIERVRDKKECRQCGVSVQGKSAVRISARFYLCMDCFKGER